MAKTHTVVSGDTLYSLGKKYGLTVDELKSINKLTSDTIKVGQVLTVSKTTHKVVSGDTLFSLAKKYETTVAALKSLNGLKSDTIKVGQILRLPEIYEEQLFLKNEDGLAYTNFAYEITFVDGKIFTGTTDNEGATEKMNIAPEIAIKEVKIFSNTINCCDAHVSHFAARAAEGREYGFYGFRTFQRMGKDLRLFPSPRDLTQGEENELRAIFGDSIPYKEIKIHEGKLSIFQKDRIAMTPMGHAFFPTPIYHKDFSLVKSDIDTWHLFVHEMVHVWQYHQSDDALSLVTGGLLITGQHGYKKSSDKRFSTQNQNLAIAYQYFHIIHKRQHLSEFNMEQQAEMIADYFVKKGTNYFNNDKSLEIKLQQLVQDFINKPKNVKLLPKSNDIDKTVWDKEPEFINNTGLG